MTTECPKCHVWKLSDKEEVITEFVERHKTNCPGEDRTIYSKKATHLTLRQQRLLTGVIR